MKCPVCKERVKMSSGNRKKVKGIYQHKSCSPTYKRGFWAIVVKGDEVLYDVYLRPY